ncbi:homocysteine-responsive endoplasmic reticulum-resident ubiquitin-like domain member 2 protein [Zeugodacus cucurbitae]|uniref:homocysteine-responsive endoplasmic reticulum-resident ubiquitin-like domain member 2 protein n=1 Tax=Zeugodacus cucurbitae TaxID=28588 RepID=UPI000596906B|nr:homocysteine-responsive endoplasmic reticulum-resident ubiquitin-like domain member 2 protein [Zeugodacus cucurbitae]XP_011178637.1 homocysteine-responsive endoplasmic reticulum-resident ubiquitin-like domain member 2 protein [Zeugodacus cucurbitae]XP_054083719.1 homocysteine-responsive endoplasmic reticulum-resident ubiquitin-like domain member 2 protein [Zeugodacus cucurbitae]
MNETAAATTSSTTPSAAAVADSASAAATTKTASTMNSAGSVASASTTTTTTTTTAKATSVKLLIKASNQQYEDQILDIDLLWTVKRLKTHLEMVYPNKPPADEQKLIYSGQLLNDSLLLKDVIRSYKDVYTHNHIIHLVCTPKNALNTNFKQKPKVVPSSSSANMSHSANTGDGLRQRHVAGTAATNAAPQISYQQQYYQQYQQQQQQNLLFPQMNQPLQNLQCPTYDPNNSQNVLPFAIPGQFNIQAMATHQVAMYHWMQQVYSQYMEQYTRMANTTTPSAGIANLATQNLATATAANLPAVGVSPLGFNPFLQQMPFIAPNTAAGAAAAAGANNPVISAATLLSQPARVQPLAQAVPETDGNTAAQAAVGEQPQQAAAQPERQQAVAPRFPNIVQEEQENRDWLDSFFAITRLAIFLTILYFNSSPLRCLVVVIIASSIYLYHIGLLRPRNERNNNNINRNNNAADADQIRRGVRQVQQAAQADERRNPDNDAVAGADEAAVDRPQTAAEAAGAESTAPVAAEAIENNDNNAASVISVLRTFVVTFFTSLLPEPPTL